ncbi:MAG: response regulator [Patescibacteria group bacterium]
MFKKKYSILIVDDDEFLVNIYKTKFEMEKFKVYTAGDGEEGLLVAQRKKPDIILLDILMPKTDGLTMLEKLKQNSILKDIPVILHTNLGQKEDVKKGLVKGASDYVIKSHFKPSEIVDKVKKILI